MHSTDYKTTGLRPEISDAALHAVQLTRLPAYGRIISRRYMGAAQLHRQVIKLHVYTRCCPAAAAVSQTAYKRSAVQLTRLPAYGRIISRRYMGAAQLHRQVLKLHVYTRCCPAAAAVSQTAYKRSAVTCSGRIPNCMHAAAVDLLQWQDTKLQWQDTKLQWQDTKLQWQDTKLQWQDTKLHARGGCIALLQWQDTKLLHRAKDEQTCNNNNSNNKARCIPAELCKLS
jgi:hypothetical protein